MMYNEHTTGPTFRAVIRVHREDVEGRYSTGLLASISPRSQAGKRWMDCGDFNDEIAAQIPAARKLKVGKSATFDCVIKGWSSKYWTDCGWEYDSGEEVLKYRRLC